VAVVIYRLLLALLKNKLAAKSKCKKKRKRNYTPLAFLVPWISKGGRGNKKPPNLKHFYTFDSTPVTCFTAFHFCATASKPKFIKEHH